MRARSSGSAAEVEVLLYGIGEQPGLLRDGRADAAMVHRPFDCLVGLDSEDLLTEEQVVILPAGHPLTTRDSVSMAEISALPDLPMARWPRHDGPYPPGPGPEVRDQAQLAQLVALGRALVVIPAPSRVWQWSEHVAVPVTDAPLVTTALAWPPRSSSLALAGLVRTAVRR